MSGARKDDRSLKNTSSKDVRRFFERVATDWDTMHLAYYDERVIERMAEVSGVGRTRRSQTSAPERDSSPPGWPRGSSGS